eukprot:2562565-Pleurochrysis_carterae.AAC.1
MATHNVMERRATTSFDGVPERHGMACQIWRTGLGGLMSNLSVSYDEWATAEPKGMMPCTFTRGTSTSSPA